jgi:hypothetical protein
MLLNTEGPHAHFSTPYLWACRENSTTTLWRQPSVPTKPKQIQQEEHQFQQTQNWYDIKRVSVAFPEAMGRLSHNDAQDVANIRSQ